MSADQVKPQAENTEAKQAKASDADVAGSNQTSVEDVQAAKASEQQTEAANNLRADSDIAGNGTETPKVGEEATAQAAKGADAKTDVAEAAEGANLQDKLLDDSKPESLEELRKLNPESLTPAQRAKLGLPALDILDPRKLAMAGGKHMRGVETRAQDSVTYNDRDVELDLNGTKVKFDDQDFGLTKVNTVADVSLELGDNVRSEKLEGVGSRHTIQGENGDAQVIEGKDGALHIRTADGKYKSMYPGEDLSIMNRAGRVVEGPEAQKAFEDYAEQFDKLGSSVYQYGMVHRELQAKVATNDGQHDLVTVSHADNAGNVDVNVKIPEGAEVENSWNGRDSKATLADGTEMVTYNGNTTIKNPNGSLIKVDGSTGEITEVPPGDAADSQFAAVTESFDKNATEGGGDGASEFSLWQPSSWLSTGAKIGNSLLEATGFDHVIDFGVDLGSDLYNDFWESDFGQSVDDFFSSDDLVASADESLDQFLAQDGNKITDVKLTEGENKSVFGADGKLTEEYVTDRTKSEAVDRQAKQQRAEIMEKLQTDDFEVKGTGDKSTSDIVTEQLDSTLSGVKGKDNTTTVDKATLDSALEKPLTGENVKDSVNEKGEKVQVDETTGMQRVEHSDGSVTVKFGVGDQAITATRQKDGTREYVTGDGAVVEKPDGRTYSSLGDVDIEGYAGFRATTIHSDILNDAMIDAYAGPHGFVRGKDGHYGAGDQSEQFRIKTEGNGEDSRTVITDKETGNVYSVDPESCEILVRGEDGKFKPIEGEPPFKIIEHEGKDFTLEAKDGTQYEINDRTARIIRNDGTSTEVSVDGDGNTSAANNDLMIDMDALAGKSPAELKEFFGNMTDEQRAKLKAEWDSLTDEQKRERMQARLDHIRSLPREQQREYMRLFREMHRMRRQARRDPQGQGAIPGARMEARTERKPDGTVGPQTNTITDADGTTLSSADTAPDTNNKVITDYSSGEPKIILNNNREEGTVTTETLNRTASGDITHIPTGTLFGADGSITDGNGNSIYDAATGSFGEGWSEGGFSGGRTEAQQAALEAAAESKANTAVGQAQAVAAKVAAAVQSGNVSAIMCSMGEVAAAYGAISGAVACAIDAGDYGLAGMLNLQTSQVNAAAGSVVATTVKVQDVNRMGGDLTGDQRVAQALTQFSRSISNPLIQRKQILRDMGRVEESESMIT